MITFFDLHTHTNRHSSNEVFILNVNEKFDEVSDSRYTSAGLHPWFLDSLTAETQFDLLKQKAKSESVVAIGECGLDKKCDTDWQLQCDSFLRQIELANKLNKPLIIHCVRAYQEVLDMLEKANVPVIFHGFNKSPELAKQILISNPNYYLSFGKGLEVESVSAVLKTIPQDRIFLETDSSVMTIDKIYNLAANSLDITMDKLRSLIIKNAQTVFGSLIPEFYE